eukprot:TRINITY_DN10306_c0_g1_i1.p1 TRINITY_DN10306_c0_g1~~TRINITY_DN10306_c0_g1_i1.p1  ORF type:complete len:555 (+),score=149.44 TRINITY_DN10306_c0_g1_i1:42-1706(+)
MGFCCQIHLFIHSWISWIIITYTHKDAFLNFWAYLIHTDMQKQRRKRPSVLKLDLQRVSRIDPDAVEDTFSTPSTSLQVGGVSMEKLHMRSPDAFVRAYGDIFPMIKKENPKKMARQLERRIIDEKILQIQRSKYIGQSQTARRVRRKVRAPRLKSGGGSSERVAYEFERRKDMAGAPLIIIHWEGVLADVGRMNIWKDADGIYERPGLVEGMKILSKHFQVAVVSMSSEGIVQRIANHFRRRGIVIDALYDSSDVQKKKGKSPTDFFQDSIRASYKRVYDDFRIKNPEIPSMVLVMGTIALEHDDIEDRDGFHLLADGRVHAPFVASVPSPLRVVRLQKDQKSGDDSGIPFSSSSIPFEDSQPIVETRKRMILKKRGAKRRPKRTEKTLLEDANEDELPAIMTMKKMWVPCVLLIPHPRSQMRFEAVHFDFVARSIVSMWMESRSFAKAFKTSESEDMKKVETDFFMSSMILSPRKGSVTTSDAHGVFPSLSPSRIAPPLDATASPFSKGLGGVHRFLVLRGAHAPTSTYQQVAMLTPHKAGPFRGGGFGYPK